MNKLNKNEEIEKRIQMIINYDIKHNTHTYGTTIMDGLSENEKKLRMEELLYIQQHPEMYVQS